MDTNILTIHACGTHGAIRFLTTNIGLLHDKTGTMVKSENNTVGDVPVPRSKSEISMPYLLASSLVD